MKKVLIGTSGFNYEHWKKIFYPEGLTQRKWLEYYSARFPTVELNVTYYRLPDHIIVGNWFRETPDDFVFAVKGSRLITQYHKLVNVDEALNNFFENVSVLGSKLGIVLWQLPPNLHFDPGRLVAFCDKLRSGQSSKNVKGAFEFRHDSWFCGQTYKILNNHNLSLCIADSAHWPTPVISTVDYVYFRFHGSRAIYSSSYSEKELQNFAKHIQKFQKQGKQVFAYFNNDAFGYAINNAKKLTSLLGL